MTSGKNISLWILAALVLIVVGVGGYYFWFGSEVNSIPQPPALPK